VTSGATSGKQFAEKLKVEWEYKMKNFVVTGIETEKQLDVGS
jgi:hypothetical protein